MKTLINASLVLVIVLVSLSAYLRLTHSGIGCANWPQCYGKIGDFTAVDSADPSQSSYQALVNEANQPLAWATPLHRLVASTLGLLIVFLNIAAVRTMKARLVSLCLLGLTVYLAILGIRSGSLYDPAVIMGNLSGGFIMLGLLGWLAFSQDRVQKYHANNRSLRTWTIFALVVVSMQILVGGLTSANFAATACLTVPDCHGSWLPDENLADAFDLTGQHEVDASGIVIGGAEQMAIHKLHRLGALASFLVLMVVGILAMRTGNSYRYAGMLIILLTCMEFAVGVLAVVSAIPIMLAVSHNWLAGLLVLALVWLLSLSRATG